VTLKYVLSNQPKHGEPEARVLTEEPIRLIENYFCPPAGKMDILKAPKHYPRPVMKYSLQEMTIVWHLYGGSDFSNSPSRKSSGKSEERGSSETCVPIM
jgi:autophagy-related protein 2